MMIEELREAFELAAQQPEPEQATIAARIKAMINGDRQWEALLSDPESLKMLDEMAKEAHQDYVRGETEEIKSRSTTP